MAGERGGGGTDLAGGMGNDQRNVGVSFVGERSLALQPAVGAAHLAVIGGEDDDRVPPQIHIVHQIHDLLESAVFVSDRV